VVEGIREHAPDLVIAHESLADDLQARGAAFDVPVICLSEAGAAKLRLRADAMLLEPVEPIAISVCAGGLLRAHHEARKLRRKAKDLGALYKLSWAFSLEGGPEHLFSYISEQTATMLEAEKAIVLGYDAETREIVGRPRGYGIPADVVRELRYPVDGEATDRWNFRKNGPLLSTDAFVDPRLLPEVVARLGMRTLLVVPMASGHRVAGLLAVGNRSGGRQFDEEDMGLLLAAGSLAAVAIDNLELHENVKKANATLQEYDRLKSQFVAMVAHDFRRPLTAIRGFAEIVNVDEPPYETVKEYMNAIVDECDGLGRLADDTLLLTKLETANIEFRWTEVDRKTLMREVIPADLAGHSVQLDVAPDLPRAVVDVHRLRQVLANLVSNAIKYSPAGGRITRRCRMEGDQAMLQVSDQGLGIPKDQQANLFQRFTRVQTDQHLAITGTGLGLYISRLIVEGHGGRIWVESEPGRGSTFCVLMPRDARPKKEQAPEPKKVPARASGPITSMFRPHLTQAVRRATAKGMRKPSDTTADLSAAAKPPAVPAPGPKAPEVDWGAEETHPPSARPPVADEPVMIPDDSQTRLYEQAENRRSPRVRKMIPIRVNYNGATLTTYTAVINREGALIICAVPVAPGTALMITSLASDRTAPFEVVRCSEADQGLYKIGVELRQVEDFWGVAYDADQATTTRTKLPRGARR